MIDYDAEVGKIMQKAKVHGNPMRSLVHFRLLDWRMKIEREELELERLRKMLGEQADQEPKLHAAWCKLNDISLTLEEWKILRKNRMLLPDPQR